MAVDESLWTKVAAKTTTHASFQKPALAVDPISLRPAQLGHDEFGWRPDLTKGRVQTERKEGFKRIILDAHGWGRMGPQRPTRPG